MGNDDFKKANIVNVIKYKIRWLLKVFWYSINKPLDILMEWM
ncbi:hypothetical protein [Fusobacterium nucleatum]